MLNSFLYAAHLTHKTKLLFILSGTCLQVESSFENSILKSFNHRAYITLGNFGQFAPFQDYIHKYTTKLDSRLEELHSILRGRYIFTAAFLAIYLKCGDIDEALLTLRSQLITLLASTIRSHERMCGYLPDKQTILNYVEKERYLLMSHYFCLDSSNKPSTKHAIQQLKHIQYGLTLVSPHTDETPFVYTSLDDMLSAVKIAEPLIFEILHDVLPFKHPSIQMRDQEFDQDNQKMSE